MATPTPINIEVALLEGGANIDTALKVTIDYYDVVADAPSPKSINTVDDLDINLGPIYWWGIDMGESFLAAGIGVFAGTDVVITVEGYEPLVFTNVSSNITGTFNLVKTPTAGEASILEYSITPSAHEGDPIAVEVRIQNIGTDSAIFAIAIDNDTEIPIGYGRIELFRTANQISWFTLSEEHPMPNRDLNLRIEVGHVDDFVLDYFESLVNWQEADPLLDNGPPVLSIIRVQQGTYSMKLPYIYRGEDMAQWTTSFSPIDLSNYISTGILSFWLYISNESELYSNSAFWIYLNKGGTFVRYVFTRAELSQGWNLLQKNMSDYANMSPTFSWNGVDGILLDIGAQGSFDMYIDDLKIIL